MMISFMKKKTNQKKRVLRGREKGIALEDLDSKLDLIVEKVELTETRLTARMDEMENGLRQEIRDIRPVVGQHTEKLQEHDKKLQEHDEEISILKQASHH